MGQGQAQRQTVQPAHCKQPNHPKGTKKGKERKYKGTICKREWCVNPTCMSCTSTQVIRGIIIIILWHNYPYNNKGDYQEWE